MTDLISGPDADSSEATAPTAIQPQGDQPVEWAPNEPAPRRRRLGLWIGIAAGALALAAGAASLLLIAPGTTIAGVSVGFMTPGMAADALSARVANTEIQLAAAGDARLTGADLGARVDATALAGQAFDDRPLWNLGSWMGDPIAATVTLDPETAESTLRAAAPDSYVDPVDATVVFDADAKKYAATVGADGSGFSLDALTAAFDDALAQGDEAVVFTDETTAVAPTITDESAAATVGELNDILAEIGFYVGEERTVPIAPQVAASWLTVEPVDGELKIDADPAKIQTAVDGLAEQVNRAAADATLVVNAAGKTLRTIAEGATGRELGDVSNVASDFADQISTGDAAYELPVEETPFATTNLVRKIEVNLSSQRLNMIENGKIIDSWRVSSGKFGTDTHTGTYTVNWKLSSQDMGRRDLTVRPYYFQPNVKWVMYFNGDQALHGVYWHSNWGTRMSHGCVGMPESLAKKLYDWSPQGVEVWVHN